MSDKDLDAFFKSSLEEMEVKPSQQVWEGIQHRLDEVEPKESKSFRFNWFAAASILLVGTVAMVLFGKKEEKVWLSKHQVAVVEEPAEAVSAPVRLNRKPMEPIHLVKDPYAGMSNEERFLAIIEQVEEPVAKIKEKRKSDATIQPMKSVLPKEGVPEVIASTERSPVVEQNVVQLAMTEQEIMEAYEDGKSKGKIRSVGDLVNFVIAKVDKREEKLVHIAKTEESDLEITGINLGLFKYRKN